MTDRDVFYRARDQRTLEFGVADVFDAPVAVVVGPQAAHCARGQLATLALVNMLARLHRRLCLQIPPAKLLYPAVVTSSRLNEAASELACQIDPFIQLSAVPGGATTAIGLGADAPVGLPWYVGADGQLAALDRSPQSFDDRNSPSLGACLAACFAASAVLHQALGQPIRPARVSVWNLCEGGAACRGPELKLPLDIGDVLQIGAGGVGSCFDYWLREFGHRGRWCALDGDVGELHNTNRSLGLFPKHAGWPSGNPQKKATVAAALIDAEPAPIWYHEFDHDARKFDLILPLANDYGVRNLVACRGEPLLLHATTSSLWEAQLHRHVPEQDDCIVCRMPVNNIGIQFGCSTVQIAQSHYPSTDAALPFLSAAAGLLLLAGLFRLQHGELLNERHNLWSLCFNDQRRYVRRAVHSCNGQCNIIVQPAARRRIHVGRRWSSADRLAWIDP